MSILLRFCGTWRKLLSASSYDEGGGKRGFVEVLIQFNKVFLFKNTKLKYSKTQNECSNKLIYSGFIGIVRRTRRIVSLSGGVDGRIGLPAVRRVGMGEEMRPVSQHFYRYKC